MGLGRVGVRRRTRLRKFQQTGRVGKDCGKLRAWRGALEESPGKRCPDLPLFVACLMVSCLVLMPWSLPERPPRGGCGDGNASSPPRHSHCTTNARVSKRSAGHHVLGTRPGATAGTSSSRGL